MSEVAAAAPSAPSPSQPSAPTTSGAEPGKPGGASTTPSPTAPGANTGSKMPSNATPTGDGELWDVKVNGKVVKMTRQEVLDHASMSHAANAKFNEAAQQRKAVDKIINTAKSNPIEALMDPALGLTKDQIRDAFEKWYAQEFIEPETLNEDQKARAAAERELKKYQEKEQKEQEEAERQKQEKLTANQREYLQNQIVEALEKSGLPKTKFFASRMAFYMRQNLLNGWEAPLDMIVRQVKNERTAMIGDITKDSSVEQLIDMFGEDVINKIRQHDLKQLREKRNFRPPGGAAPTEDAVMNNTEKVYSSDVNKKLRQMRMGKF